jgi:hypothetical protein
MANYPPSSQSQVEAQILSPFWPPSFYVTIYLLHKDEAQTKFKLSSVRIRCTQSVKLNSN